MLFLMLLFIVDSGPCLAERSGPTGPYEWLSYGEVEERALAFGAGLSEIGVEVGVNSYIGIYSRNNIEASTHSAPNQSFHPIFPLPLISGWSQSNPATVIPV